MSVTIAPTGAQITPATVVRRIILVVGMHRSGTSALTRVLHLCGAAVPSVQLAPNEENPDGFWEPRNIVLVHDELLASLGSNWRDYRAFPRDWFSSLEAAGFRNRIANMVEAELSPASVLLIKDPRLCRLLPLWQQMCRERDIAVSFVIPVRNPLEVAASLERRDIAPAEALLLWLRHFVEAERDTRGCDRCFASYDELMRNGSELARNIAGTLHIHPSLPAAELDGQINAFLNEHRRHHRRSPEALQASDQVSSWVKVAYAWALQATTGREPPPTDLDAIHIGLQAADKLFRPLLDASTSKAESSATRVQTLELQLQVLETGQQALLRERQEMQEERRGLHVERTMLHSERGRLSQQVDMLRDKLSQAELTAQILVSSTSWRITAPARWLGRRLKGLWH